MCPYPKYAIEPLLDKLPEGAQLNLLVDCPAATGDVPRIAQERGFAVPRVEQIGPGEWQIVIRG
jgi:TusA-related sulfurtransferase